MAHINRPKETTLVAPKPRGKPVNNQTFNTALAVRNAELDKLPSLPKALKELNEYLNEQKVGTVEWK
jgi:hypothetical protein